MVDHGVQLRRTSGRLGRLALLASTVCRSRRPSFLRLQLRILALTVGRLRQHGATLNHRRTDVGTKISKTFRKRENVTEIKNKRL